MDVGSTLEHEESLSKATLTISQPKRGVYRRKLRLPLLASRTLEGASWQRMERRRHGHRSLHWHISAEAACSGRVHTDWPTMPDVIHSRTSFGLKATPQRRTAGPLTQHSMSTLCLQPLSSKALHADIIHLKPTLPQVTGLKMEGGALVGALLQGCPLTRLDQHPMPSLIKRIIWIRKRADHIACTSNCEN